MTPSQYFNKFEKAKETKVRKVYAIDQHRDVEGVSFGFILQFGLVYAQPIAFHVLSECCRQSAILPLTAMLKALVDLW